MVEQIKEWDIQLFLYLNRLHNPWLDVVMYWVTDRFFWIPLYAVIILLVYRRFGLPGFWLIVAASTSVALADQFTSGFMKPYFARLRPCYEVTIQHTVYVLRGCGGRFSFASSHASTTFALATSLWLYVRKVFPYVWIMFIWATVVSYSRIYVGVHYPVDLLTGAIAGATIALMIYLMFQLLLQKIGYQIKPLPKAKVDHLLDKP